MTTETTNLGPALAMIEIDEIPVGLRALDALVKEAVVALLGAGTIQCGSYLLAFGGEVEPVARSFRRAVDVAGSHVVDQVLLPFVEPRIPRSIRIRHVRWPAPGDTLGVVETKSSPTLLRAIDKALKGTGVELVELRLGDGLGGKAIASLFGTTPDVEAAIALAGEGIDEGLSADATTTVIRNVDPILFETLCSGSGFFKEWRG